MDTVEDLEEGEVDGEVDGDSVSEEALPPGLLLAWEGEDCRDVAISSVELRECLSHRVILLMAALGLCPMVMAEHLWGQCREPIPMLRR